MTWAITWRKEAKAETGSEPSQVNQEVKWWKKVVFFFFLTYTNKKKNPVSIHVMTANTSKTTAGKKNNIMEQAV